MPTSPEQARHDLQFQILRTASPWLCAYYVLITAAHAGYLDEPMRTRMVAVAATSAGIFGGLSLVRDRALVRNHAHLWGLLMVLLVAGNSGIHLIATGEAFQTTNLLLTVVGAAILLTSIRLFVLTLVLALASFAAGMLLHPGDPSWPHFGFALFGANALAATAFATRRATHNAQIAAENERDRTELARKRRAAEAEAAAARYQAVVSMSPAAIVVHRDGQVLFANKAASELIGAGDASVLVGSRLYGLFPPEDEDRIAAWNEAAIAGTESAEVFTTRLRALAGPWPDVQLETAVISWEDELAVILVATDISSRRALEQLQTEILDVAHLHVRRPVRKALEELDAGLPEKARDRLERALRTLDEVEGEYGPDTDRKGQIP